MSAETITNKLPFPENRKDGSWEENHRYLKNIVFPPDIVNRFVPKKG